MDPTELLLGLGDLANKFEKKTGPPESLEELTDTLYNLLNDYLPVAGKDYEAEVTGKTNDGDMKVSFVSHTAIGKNFLDFVTKQLESK